MGDHDLVSVVIMDCFDLAKPWFAEDDVEGSAAIEHLEPARGTNAAYFDGTEPSAEGCDLHSVRSADSGF